MNAALALTAAVLHFERPDRPRGRAASRAVEVVSGRFSTRRLPDGRDARGAAREEPGRLDRGAALARRAATPASCSR